jgi:hypothetical protein
VSSKARAKGTRWESDITRFLNHHDAERLVQTGASDQGDIRVLDWILQARDRAAIDLSGSVDDAHAQLLTYQRLHPGEGVKFSAAVIKRRRRGVADGYVVLTLADFERLLWK